MTPIAPARTHVETITRKNGKKRAKTRGQGLSRSFCGFLRVFACDYDGTWRAIVWEYGMGKNVDMGDKFEKAAFLGNLSVKKRRK